MASNSKAHGDFGNGSVTKLILGQAIPLTLAQFVQLIYNIVDRIYIGHMPGDDSGMALTGIGLCFPVITLIASFVNLVATGSAPVCSMARGKQDHKKAQDVLTNAFTLQILVSICIALLVFVTKKPLLYLLGASDVTYTYASEYLNIYLFGTLFFALGTGMNTFINLQGYPRMGMLTTVIGAVINLFLDPIFIFVMGLGVKGAATATVVSQACSAVWVTQFLMKKDHELKLDFSKLGIKTYVLKEVLLLGIPGFIVGATNCAVQSVCNATLSITGGDTYIGIMTIVNSVREMIGLPINGITSGSQPVLSYNYGAKNYDRVKKAIKVASTIALTYTAIFWGITQLFPQFFVNIFSSDEEILQMGAKPLAVYFTGFIFMALQFAGQSTFTALGRAKHSIFFSIFRKIIIVVPLTILLPRIPSLGVMGVFGAEPVSNLIGGCACFTTMYFTVYRKLKNENKSL